ncbi:unnamed protein product [Vitrella brassicaformis CCMP3155]|uniref:MYND-type domain-containing protein n=3 Tax=Vitrella brassicaformis TaxID=1169539 RepID=A0A0G4GAZ3_VITBC|nr:unnamed protein product [Vitrella brassicaformis CCMP3155]|eukprot:CEM26293.1 unnamed protein product [Vitrella brassicaformis CCMP3155]
MSKPIDYSKWDNLDDSSDEDDGPPPSSASRPAAPSAQAVAARLASMAIGRGPMQPAPPSSTSSAVDDRLPFSSSEMPGYKVRMDASTPDPELELQQCIVCGKRPELGQRLKVCDRCVREVSPLYCSEDCLKQHFQQGQHTREMCRMGRAMYVEQGSLRGNRHAVRYLLGWMTEDAFFKHQRQKQQEIQDEIAAYGRPSHLKMSVSVFNTVDFAFGVVELASSLAEGHALLRHPPADTGGVFYPDCVIYPSYQVFPIAWREVKEPTGPVLEVMLAERIVIVMSNIIIALLALTARCLGVIGKQYVEGDVNALFWRKMTCPLPMGDRTAHFYFIPAPCGVVTDALTYAAKEVFSDEEGREIDALVSGSALVRTGVMTLQQRVMRDEWRREIEWEIGAMDGMSDAIDGMCQEYAAQRGIQPRALKAAFIDKAVAFTDVFRRHLIEYADGMGEIVGKSFAQLTELTDDEMRQIKAEVAAAEYPADIQELIAAESPAYAEDVDGPIVTLADGRRTCEMDLLLRTQGLL